MTDPMASRYIFLHHAAHLLAISSPSACASLGSARDRLMAENDLQAPSREWDTHRRETCGACGNLMIPGWSCEVSNKAQPRKRPRKGKNKPSDLMVPNTNLVYHCLRCLRSTEQLLQRQSRRQVKSTKNIMTLEIRQASEAGVKQDELKLPKTANASSKQRQKARKGGLQAMLEKNKTQTSSQGLDLMDFAM
ncbi:hypothetical protein GQ44DRAFT_770052 [Phaeosphaeriaceae sp. PMI808]|nr:hypothetical protein GQ44DRAFT_770052 [Phaeosphaeriaceae sp. PMI808]